MTLRKIFKNFIFVILLLATVLFVQGSIHAQNEKSAQDKNQSEDEVIRIDSTLVTVPTTVLDRDGRYIANLKKEEFQIFEDGVEQEIALFEPTEKPFTALLLLDVSGSMFKQMANLTHAANAFVTQMRADDQLIVATFSGDGKIQVILKATKKRNFKQEILLQTINGDGFTTTFDAVERAIKYMKNIQGRRAIILFSDAELYGNKASAKSNLRDAEEQESIIYTIRFGADPIFQPSYLQYGTSEEDIRRLIEKKNDYMNGLAQKTGGRSYRINDNADFKKTFETISLELGQQYSLSYYPKKQPEAGQRRQIKVKVHQPNLVVRARDSNTVESTKTKQK